MTQTTGPARPGSRTSRLIYVGLALGLVVVAVIGVIVASNANPSKVTGSVDVAHLPLGPTPPGLDGAKGWINSEPLTPAALKGKVVVYDFWTYSCVNCVRTLPYLRSWYDRYAKDGLVVIGVHSPEFDFEKDHANVRRAVQRLHVDYPVALDDDMAIWNAFGNMYWPEKYVVDRDGRLRYDHIGEGGYRETENVLRALLGVAKSAPRAHLAAGDSERPQAPTSGITQETYLGLRRGGAGAQSGAHTYPKQDGPLHPGQAQLVGPWDADTEHVTSSELGSTIVLGYHAREVNLVMGSATGQPIRVLVELDGSPLPADARTSQTVVDANGNTYIDVTSSDLYRLVLGPSVATHTLRLIAQAPGLEAFAFTFGT